MLKQPEVKGFASKKNMGRKLAFAADGKISSFLTSIQKYTNFQKSKTENFKA